MKKNLSRALSLLLVLSLMLVLPAGAAFAEGEPTLVTATYSNLDGNMVKAGGSIDFAAIANNFTSSKWHFYDADGNGPKEPPASLGRSITSGIWGDGLYTYISLTNVPASMDGWSVQAEFINASGSTFSGKAAIHIAADILTITQQPVSQTVAPNSSAVLSVGVNAASGVTYQWYVNNLNNTSSGTKIDGANTNTYTATPEPGVPTYYYVVISKLDGSGAVVSNTAAVTRSAAVISILQAPSSTSLNVGDKVTLFVSATCNNGKGVNYQWFSNAVNSNQGGLPISGATGTSYIVDGSAEGTTYYYVECSAKGAEKVTTNAAAVTVKKMAEVPASVEHVEGHPEIKVQPTGANADGSQRTVAAGGSITYTAAATGADTYKWYLVGPGGSPVYGLPEKAGNFSGLTVGINDTGDSSSRSDSITLNGVPQSLNGWCVQIIYTNAKGNTASNGAIIHVTNATTPTGGQTTTTTGNTGTVNASSVNVRSTPNGTIIGSLNYGTGVVINDTSIPNWYNVSANGLTGYVYAPYVTVNSGVVVTNGVVTITKHPIGETVNAGGSATFIAHAANATSVTWRLVSPDASNTVYAANGPATFGGLQVGGANSDTLLLANIPTSLNGWYAEAMFSGQGGPVYTNGARITVGGATGTWNGGTGTGAGTGAGTGTGYGTGTGNGNTGNGTGTGTGTGNGTGTGTGTGTIGTPTSTALTITGQPAGLTLESGKSGTLAVVAKAGSEAVHYQWYKVDTNTNQGGTAIAGATASSYTPEEITGTTYYYVQVWTGATPTEENTLTSRAASVTYTAPATTIEATPEPTEEPVATAEPTAEPAENVIRAETVSNESGNRNARVLLGVIIGAATAALVLTFILLRINEKKGKEEDEEYDDV